MDLATASRDHHLMLRRVERQQWLVERLCAAHGELLMLVDALVRDEAAGRGAGR